MRHGQAAVETVLAVVVLTVLFFWLLQLSQLVTARIMLDHAAARAARARAVGFNDFMCLKSARVAMIPVAGRRTWPEEGDFTESSRIPIYLCTDNEALARGVLEYERWPGMRVSAESGGGVSPEATAEVSLEYPVMLGDLFPGKGGLTVNGKAAVESHFPFYMNDSGL